MRLYGVIFRPGFKFCLANKRFGCPRCHWSTYWSSWIAISNSEYISKPSVRYFQLLSCRDFGYQHRYLMVCLVPTETEKYLIAMICRFGAALRFYYPASSCGDSVHVRDNLPRMSYLNSFGSHHISNKWAASVAFDPNFKAYLIVKSPPVTSDFYGYSITSSWFWPSEKCLPRRYRVLLRKCLSFRLPDCLFHLLFSMLQLLKISCTFVWIAPCPRIRYHGSGCVSSSTFIATGFTTRVRRIYFASYPESLAIVSGNHGRISCTAPAGTRHLSTAVSSVPHDDSLHNRPKFAAVACFMQPQLPMCVGLSGVLETKLWLLSQ